MEKLRRAAAVAVAAVVVGVLPAPAATPTAQAAAPLTAGRLDRPAQAKKIDAAAYGRRVLVLTNKQRRKHGCVALHWQYQLRNSARRHTALMAATDLLSHLLASELGLVARILHAGYRPWSRLAENIAVGYPTPASVVSAWMASPEHRRNILDCRLRDMGVGVKVDRTGTIWWTQDFGRH